MFFEEKIRLGSYGGNMGVFWDFFLFFIFYNLKVEAFVGIRGLEIWFCFYFIYIYIKPKLLELPHFSTSALFKKNKIIKKKKK